MKYFLIVFVSVFFLISVSECYVLLFDDVSQYAFGSDFFPKYSFYKSYGIYLSFNLLVVILSVVSFWNFKTKSFYYSSIPLLILELFNICN